MTDDEKALVEVLRGIKVGRVRANVDVLGTRPIEVANAAIAGAADALERVVRERDEARDACEAAASRIDRVRPYARLPGAYTNELMQVALALHSAAYSQAEGEEPDNEPDRSRPADAGAV